MDPNPRFPSYGEFGAIDLPVWVPWMIILVTVPRENIWVPTLKRIPSPKTGVARCFLKVLLTRLMANGRGLNS